MSSVSSVEYTIGKRGKQNAILDGFIYHLDRRRDERSYWKCNLRANNNCTGRLVLNGDICINTPHHNHLPMPAEIQVHKAKVSLKNRAATSDETPSFRCS